MADVVKCSSISLDVYSADMEKENLDPRTGKLPQKEGKGKYIPRKPLQTITENKKNKPTKKQEVKCLRV